MPYQHTCNPEIRRAVAAQGPFQPALSAQPNDWTMSITYGGCASGCGGLNLPGSLAIDSGGNVLVANYFGGAISKFSPTGVPASATGFPGVGLNQSYGIAVDGYDNAWVTNGIDGNGRSEWKLGGPIAAATRDRRAVVGQQRRRGREF